MKSHGGTLRSIEDGDVRDDIFQEVVIEDRCKEEVKKVQMEKEKMVVGVSDVVSGRMNSFESQRNLMRSLCKFADWCGDRCLV